MYNQTFIYAMQHLIYLLAQMVMAVSTHDQTFEVHMKRENLRAPWCFHTRQRLGNAGKHGEAGEAIGVVGGWNAGWADRGTDDCKESGGLTGRPVHLANNSESDDQVGDIQLYDRLSPCPLFPSHASLFSFDSLSHAKADMSRRNRFAGWLWSCCYDSFICHILLSAAVTPQHASN